jgi:uncharacterized protein
VALLDRGLTERVISAWASSPVVVLEGLRATGKTTLAREFIGTASYRNLANPAERLRASEDVRGWISTLPNRTIIDEAQVVPDLQVAIKERVDRVGTEPGQFLLTGSARLNTHEMGGSDPLVGRAARLRLHPFAQCELEGNPRDLVSALFESDPLSWMLASTPMIEVLRRARQGGFPFRRPSAGIAPAGDEPLRLYVDGLFDGDIYQSGRNSEMITRLFRWLAGRSGAMRNVADFGAKTDLDKRTVIDYLDALRQVNLVETVPGFRVDASSRETERDRLFVSDPALITDFATRTDDEVLRTTDMVNAVTETFVATELLRTMGWSSQRVRPFHWRENARHEVDILLEREDGKIVAIEVKSAADARTDHAAGLRALRTAHPSRFHRGFVIHAGDHVTFLDDDIWAIPYSALWMVGESLPRAGQQPNSSAAARLADAVAQIRASRETPKVSIEKSIADVRSALVYANELMVSLATDLNALGFEAVTSTVSADALETTQPAADIVVWQQHVRTVIRSVTGRSASIVVTGQVRSSDVIWTFNDGDANSSRVVPSTSNHRKLVDDFLTLIADKLPALLGDLANRP